VLLVAGVAAVVSYLVPVYLQTTEEVVRDDHVGRLPLAWTPPNGLPTDERFGFPYQAGWKAIGALFADGTLQGSYDSNEQPQVTHWYTRGAWRCSTQPRYFLLAENVQDEIEISERTVNAEYRQIGTVTVAGEPKLRVYQRLMGERRSGNGRPTTWAVEEQTEIFERRVSAPTLDPGPWARGVLGREAVPLANTFGEAIELLGYQIYAENPVPGGVVRVDLSWLPRVSSRERHRIDVQLGQDPRIGDSGGPGCDETGDDKDWRANRPFVQRVSIPISPTAAPGSYPLLVSVSPLDGSGPLQPAGPGATGGALLEIGQVKVSAR
jgi:hypothetical protein